MSAYNNVGLFSTLSSDGFVVDIECPVAGIVFNSGLYTDSSYQNSSVSFSLSWQGFVDYQSGIKSYHVAIGEDGINVTSLKFTDVGLLSRYTLKGLKLEQGSTYRAFVKALDASGHISDVSVSRGRKVDVTPPNGYICTTFHLVSTDTKTLTDHIKSVFVVHNMKKNALYTFSGRLSTHSIDITAVLTIDRFHVSLPLTINHDKSRSFKYNFLSPFSGHHNITVAFNANEDVTIQTNFSSCPEIQPTNTSAVKVTQIGPSTVAVNIMIMDNESYVNKVTCRLCTTVELQWLEHHWDHRNLFEIWVIRATVPVQEANDDDLGEVFSIFCTIFVSLEYSLKSRLRSNSDEYT